MTAKKVIDIFNRYLVKAIDNPTIKKPYAWALYQTWKEVDRKEGEKHEDN